MIISLEGKIAHQAHNWIILETASGIGYQVFVKFAKLNNNNDLQKYFIYHHIKEDRQELYGFETIDERQFFIQLLSVSGVGPKMAMAIIGIADTNKIVSSIREGETTILTAVSGVGKKLAAKIIVELRNKVGEKNGNYLPTAENEEVAEALKNLGYKINEISPALNKVPENIKTNEEKIKWVLKNLKVIHN